MPILSDTKFLVAHYMPYTDLPDECLERDSLWVDIPNAYYDPHKGHALYERYLGEAVLAEELGFDGLCINEHHATPASMMPVPSIIASAIFARTKKLRVCIMGTPPNLENPHRLAEGYAMLDVMSGGRLEVAIPLGTPMEYWVNPVAPATARDRLHESIDIMLKSWETQTGEPKGYDGKFYHYKYLNVWPRPIQQPHPPIFLVGSGSLTTVEMAARLGFGYAATFSPIPKQMKALEIYRQKSAEAGHDPDPSKFPLTVMVYVADTDEQAVEEMTPWADFYFGQLLKSGRFIELPGYIPVDEFRRRDGKFIPESHGVFDWKAIEAVYRVVAGSPETVANQLEKWAEETGSNRIICEVHIGNMPHDKVVSNMTKLAKEVIPILEGRRDGAPKVEQSPQSAYLDPPEMMRFRKWTGR